MYTLGFVLLGVGIFVAFAAFVFVAKNMFSMGGGSIDKLFSGHIGAMIVMGLGSLFSFSGIIILVATFLSQFVK